MTTNEYLKKHFEIDTKINEVYSSFPKREWYPKRRPRIVCKDGFNFSVQADYATYCTPRITLWPETWGNGYSEVELGFPSEADELISDYAEDPDKLTKTVYPYLPIDIVDKLIEKHGGFATE